MAYGLMGRARAHTGHRGHASGKKLIKRKKLWGSSPPQREKRMEVAVPSGPHLRTAQSSKKNPWCSPWSGVLAVVVRGVQEALEVTSVP